MFPGEYTLKIWSKIELPWRGRKGILEAVCKGEDLWAIKNSLKEMSSLNFEEDLSLTSQFIFAENIIADLIPCWVDCYLVEI